MEDFKNILREHNVELRESVNALEVYRYVVGLSQFDFDHIKCDATNYGNSIAIDSLISAINRKGSGSFINFVRGLQKCGNKDIADAIIKDTYLKCPNIYSKLSKPQPIATVSPNNISPSPPTCAEQHTNALDRGIVGYKERFAINSANISTEESTENMLETKLEYLRNEDFLYLAGLLNIDRKWDKLATKLKLRRKEIKQLECQESPSEKLLDDNSQLPVQELLNYLDKANLTDVADGFRRCLNIDNSNLQFGSDVSEDMVNVESNIDLPTDNFKKASRNKFEVPIDSGKNIVDELMEWDENRKQEGDDISDNMTYAGHKLSNTEFHPNQNPIQDVSVRHKISNLGGKYEVERRDKRTTSSDKTEKLVVTEENPRNSEITPEKECEILRKAHSQDDRFRDIQDSLPSKCSIAD